MFNLFISSNSDSWTSSPYECERNRAVVEHTVAEIRERYRLFDESAVNELKSFPALFVTEQETIASKIGYITNIRVHSSSVFIEFEIDKNLPFLPKGAIEAMGKDIDLNQGELYRTHWAVKDVPIFDILLRHKYLNQQQIKASQKLRIQDPRIVPSEQLVGELDTSKPLILLLGDIVYEGVISALRATDRQYKNKLLDTSLENWKSILKYFNDYEIECVLIKLNARTISLMGSDIYRGVKEELFKKIGAKRNLVFVYEDILSGHFEEIEEGLPVGHYYRPSEEDRKEAFKFLAESNIKVLPYKRNAEVTVMATNFISETEQNLIFRMYIPSGRLWSDESNKIIQLFMDYMNKAAKVKVRLDQNKTDKGVIYEIHSEEITSLSGIEVSEFSQFMNLCISDHSAAEKILQSRDIDQKEIRSILSRYSKEVKRIVIDIKHEREQKILDIRQRLESELTDVSIDNLNDINLLVDSVIPPPLSGTMAAISIDQYSIALPSIGKLNNLNVNINPQIIERANGIIAQEIRGDQYISSEAQQMLSLIREHAEAEDKAVELEAAVHEIEDKNTAKSGRLNAKHKIKKFLIDIVSKTGNNIAVSSLQQYIENLLL